MTSPNRILARVRPQAWINDNAVDIDGTTTVDVTERVFALRYDEIRELRDCSEDAEHLVEGLTHFAGPYNVYIERALEAFFGLTRLADLESADFQRKQAILDAPGEAISDRAYTDALLSLVQDASARELLDVGTVREALEEAWHNRILERAKNPVQRVSAWDDDPEFPAEDWRDEVTSDDTRLGYLEWVESRREAMEEEEEA